MSAASELENKDVANKEPALSEEAAKEAARIEQGKKDAAMIEQVEVYARAKLGERKEYPLEYTPGADGKLTIKIGGLQLAEFEKPEPPLYKSKNKPLPESDISQLTPESIGAVHRVENAVSELIPFGKRNGSVQTNVDVDTAEVTVNTRVVDAAALNPSVVEKEKGVPAPKSEAVTFPRPAAPRSSSHAEPSQFDDSRSPVDSLALLAQTVADKRIKISPAGEKGGDKVFKIAFYGLIEGKPALPKEFIEGYCDRLEKVLQVPLYSAAQGIENGVVAVVEKDSEAHKFLSAAYNEKTLPTLAQSVERENVMVRAAGKEGARHEYRVETRLGTKFKKVIREELQAAEGHAVIEGLHRSKMVVKVNARSPLDYALAEIAEKQRGIVPKEESIAAQVAQEIPVGVAR